MEYKHKRIYINIGMGKKTNKQWNKNIRENMQDSVDLINNNISRNVQDECAKRLHRVFT